jgi:hypothetical protein
LLWIPSCDHVIISSNSSTVPYPPETNGQLSKSSTGFSAIDQGRKKIIKRSGTWKSNERFGLSRHLGFPLVHVRYNLHFSHAFTGYLLN